jgi:hypothetical protein
MLDSSHRSNDYAKPVDGQSEIFTRAHFAHVLYG